MLFPAGESLVSDIPDGDGKIDNLFLQCRVHAGQLHGYVICREDMIEQTVMGSSDKECRPLLHQYNAVF